MADDLENSARARRPVIAPPAEVRDTPGEARATRVDPACRVAAAAIGLRPHINIGPPIILTAGAWPGPARNALDND